MGSSKKQSIAALVSSLMIIQFINSGMTVNAMCLYKCFSAIEQYGFIESDTRSKTDKK